MCHFCLLLFLKIGRWLLRPFRDIFDIIQLERLLWPWHSVLLRLTCHAVQCTSVQCTDVVCAEVPTLQCSTLHCSAMHCTALHCTADTLQGESRRLRTWPKVTKLGWRNNFETKLTEKKKFPVNFFLLFDLIFPPEWVKLALMY